MDLLPPGPSRPKHHRQAPLDVSKLHEQALSVLQHNDLGQSTRPAPHLYPHQWLWDSCFIAIGLRHVDIHRAKTELLSLLRGQWDSGMIPHEIFAPNSTYHAGKKVWRSHQIEGSPKGVHTSGITQPPMIAEAVVRVGEKLGLKERRAFYEQMYSGLVHFHQWLYRERDPHNTGLVTLIHSHETGMDNTPYWTRVIRPAAPVRVRALQGIGQEGLLDYLRKDKKAADNPTERLSSVDIHTMYHIITQIRRKDYDLASLLALPYASPNVPLLQDVFFNAILIRANTHLRAIALALGKTLPDDLQLAINKAPHAFETLFANGNYWSRNLRNDELIQEPTIAGFLALYAGTIPPAHAHILAQTLQRPTYWATYGIASVPTDSLYFGAHRYWQGPVWVNTNWLIADGLERYGYTDLASKLRQQTIQLVAKHGMYEYFSPIDGSCAGTHDFSWTAALVIDMLEREYPKGRVAQLAKKFRAATRPRVPAAV